MLNNLFARLMVGFADLKDREDGQAMVEYALILVLVSIIAIIALTAIGTNVNTVFEAVRDALAGVPLP